jgi:hypothetical protein
MIHGCCVEYDFNEQLTADDLSHLYFDRDTVLCDEDGIEFTDSVTFLLSSRDTLTVAANTSIWLVAHALGISYYANGKSSISFDRRVGYYYASIKVDRQFSSKTIRVSKGDGGNDLDKVISEPITLDTAIILGRLYESVYKFDLPRENGELGIKSVYFAKKYGFIKIEGHDGSKLELIEVKSKGVKETY